MKKEFIMRGRLTLLAIAIGAGLVPTGSANAINCAYPDTEMGNAFERLYSVTEDYPKARLAFIGCLKIGGERIDKSYDVDAVAKCGLVVMSGLVAMESFWDTVAIGSNWGNLLGVLREARQC